MNLVIKFHRSYLWRWLSKYTYYHITFLHVCLCLFVCMCAWIHIWMWAHAPKCSFKVDGKYFIWHLNASKSDVIPSLHLYSFSLPSSILPYLPSSLSPSYLLLFFLITFLSSTQSTLSFVWTVLHLDGLDWIN